MKLYIISGLGADFKVLEKLEFNENIEVVFLDWLIPNHKETFNSYMTRMTDRIDVSEDFYLLGYSFGGIVAQEIHKIAPAQKIVILGSIKSEREASLLMKIGRFTRIHKYIPVSFFNENSSIAYAFIRKLFDPKNPKLLEYFRVKDPYYLKWSIGKIIDWKNVEQPNIIQIMADKDIVFPIKNSKPDYIIRNGTHLFPATKYKEVSAILKNIFK